MNYIGSKKSLLSFLDSVFQMYIPQPIHCFGDAFAGTGVVSSFIQTHYGSKIIASDTEYYSWLVTYIQLNVPYSSAIQNKIDRLNALTLFHDGLITNNYSPKGERMYFTEENARRIDTYRNKLEEWKPSITSDEYLFLLGSLLVASDKVANVSCTYGAFLKKFKRSAIKPLFVVPLHTNRYLQSLSTVYHCSMDQVDWNNCDVVYMDPPYNGRQYGANYFLLNYILRYEDIPIKGKTGIPDYYKSPFCRKGTVRDTFQQAIESIQCDYICLSYNDEGLLSLNELKQLLLSFGSVILVTKPYKKFKAHHKVKRDTVLEYLWILNKSATPSFQQIDY